MLEFELVDSKDGVTPEVASGRPHKHLYVGVSCDVPSG